MSRLRTRIRKTTITPYPSAAAGSVVITQGQTRVLCTASLSPKVPDWIRRDAAGEPEHGWVTAEYNMLPGSTPQRKKRGPDSRATEIQRFIARALRAAVDLKKVPGVITCDCDVIVADGGTRTAAVTGAWVALAQALGDVRIEPVAAVSVGIVDGRTVLDLDYALDVNAEVDMNVVMTGRGRFVEVQGTGEKGVFDRTQLNAMLDLAAKGVRQLMKVQRTCLKKLE